MSYLDTHITKEKADIMFAAMDTAGVSVTLFSTLCRTSRATLYRWRNEPEKGIDKIRFNLAYDIAVRLNRAVEQGKLPLKDKLDKANKEATVRKIVLSAKQS